MRIYEPLVAEGYEWVNCCDDDDYEVLLSLDGEPIAQVWRPPHVRRVAAEDNGKCVASDFPWLGAHALVMRSSAVMALRDILESNGELLPLRTDDGVTLFVLNARTIDALDESQAEVLRFPGSNRVMRITKVAFHESRVRNVDLFRLPYRASCTYVSQKFVDRFHQAGLRGLAFTQVFAGE